MFDVVIIGGGLAGWRAAEAAVNSGGLVALVANGAGNSPDIHAINIPVRPEDSIERFIDDTLASGRGACDTSLVEILCRESISLLDEFPFDREPNGSYATLQPVGCSVPRCVSINHHIGAYALARIKKTLDGSITIFNGKVANVVRNPSSTFALTLSCPLTASLEARAVVIATGGWCGKYDFSDNPPELQGDGIAFAQSLGAAVRDMDAVQYEPTVALAPEKLRTIPVITTMLYEGATFRNKDGKEFLSNKHANKDEISHAIFAEIAAGRGVPAPAPSNATTQPSNESPTSSRQSFGVWFDATAVPHGILTTRYADTVNRYAACGIDISREPMLVAPAPHTSLGGVVIDTKCRVISLSGHPIPGLYAAGEVTGGIHGLNRIGGNAGTEVLVFGRIAGREAASFARSLLS